MGYTTKNWPDLFNFLNDLVFDVNILKDSLNHHVCLLKILQRWKIHISVHMVLVEIQLILQQAFKGMERESVVTV